MRFNELKMRMANEPDHRGVDAPPSPFSVPFFVQSKCLDVADWSVCLAERRSGMTAKHILALTLSLMFGKFECRTENFRLGSSGRGLGIGTFVRTDDWLQCVLMPAYSDAEGAQTYLDFLRNDQEELWVREAEYDETKARWEVHPTRVGVLWPKRHVALDLSRSPQEILRYHVPSEEQGEGAK
jgi:hypothetical protein